MPVTISCNGWYLLWLSVIGNGSQKHFAIGVRGQTGRRDRSFEWSGLTCVGLFDSYQLHGRWFFVQWFKSTFWPFLGLFWFAETTQKHGCSMLVIQRHPQTHAIFSIIFVCRSLRSLSSKLLFTKPSQSDQNVLNNVGENVNRQFLNNFKYQSPIGLWIRIRSKNGYLIQTVFFICS